MKAAGRFFLLAIFAVALSASARAQGRDYSKIEFTAEQVAPNLYMLSGSAGADPSHQDAAGGRIGLLTGPDGIFMVDAQYEPLTDKVLAAIRRISPAPIRFLVNTHVHGDHTGGNANFAKMGVTIFAREELRDELAHPVTPGIEMPPAASNPPPPPAAALPVVTYGLGSTVKFHMNGEVIDLIPVRAAHTGGDTMVRFENANAVMIGDFYRNYGYPYIDTNNGGTLKGALDALNSIMALAGPDTKLIPGHGTIIHRADLVPYRDMILAVQAKVQQMIAQGKTRQEVLAAKVTAPYDASVPGSTAASADRFIGMVYSELKAGR